MKENRTILLVEDDIELAGMISDFLSDQGFAVNHVDNGSQAIHKILESNPDLVLLDVMLPGTNGIEVAHKVRPSYQGIIIMLTAKDDEISEINSLNRGADAFLEKPVRPHILLAHINAHLRRISGNTTEASSEAKPTILRNQNLLLDIKKQEAYLDNSRLNLTTAELHLLLYFMKRAGETVTRVDLYRDLRNIEYDGLDRSMDMRISTLRKKMNDDKPPYRFIKTIRNLGYMLTC
ncbi:MAG: response regulator transcription factor [Cellvibrionaceae bacterium]|nr:response regulator transcription factor [Cellvibrionaceae bacterium]